MTELRKTHSHKHTNAHKHTLTQTHTQTLTNCKMQPVSKTLKSGPLISFIALMRFAASSAVMHVWSSSFRPQFDRHSLNPSAIFSPMWSVGKYAVCRQLLFNSKLSFMKWLRYVLVVLLDHISVVVA